MRRFYCYLFLSFSIALHHSGFAQLADGKCRFLGNIISSYVPSDFTTYWNQVTPENSGKWGSVESVQDDMKWAALDLAYNMAKSKGYPFKHHAFVWGQQQPSWISSLTLEEQKAEVEEWIKSYCERYPDTDFIDVVNEPLHAPPAYAQALGGAGTTGWDWVIWSFEKARQYCPNAKLILNDYNIINNDYATTQYLQIINLLKTRNLIDGIGEQGHFFETTPLSTLTTNLNKLYATGLPIYISEYDVNLADDTEQLNKYKEQFHFFWTHPGVQGITLWGYRQGEIWRTNAYLVRSNGTARPALTWLQSYVPGAAGGVFCQTVTDVEEDHNTRFTAYPNPVTSGKLTVELQDKSSTIKITDINGREIKSVANNGQPSITIDMDVAPGVYIMRIGNNKQILTRKIVVEQ